MTANQVTGPFRLAYVPGVTPGKWIRVWEERLPQVPLTLVPVAAPDGERALREGAADAGLIRLPVDRTVLSAIPLYTEATVVVVPKDHLLAAADEVSVEDLAQEVIWHPLDETIVWPTRPGQPAHERPATTAEAVEVVAAGVGLLVVPQSLARLHHRRDLTYRPVSDAAQSQVALCWPEARTTDLVDEFIGIVRGRTVNSSRGRAQATQEPGKATGATGKATGATGGQPRKKPAAAPARGAGRPRSGGGRAGGGGTAAKRGKPRRRS
ncbi:LysR family substrate-binding domain-containing protein [Kitasatospora sp. NPDC052896]|uniref:LysR family substrate-binding domain-containing protein n=1 Tax=Kitasatospora sp. NPDC052896 TaxID=3364061 RepID=UPI0037C7DEFE